MKKCPSHLLTAPVRPLVLSMALPAMIGMIASSLGALMDTLLLGSLDARMLSAVSVSLPLLTLIQTLGFTLGMGAGSFVSRCLGRNDKPAAFTAASTACFSALAVSAAFCLIAFPWTDRLVSWLGAPSDALEAAAAYARCVLASGPVLCMNLVLSSLLRAQGKTVSNMIAFIAGAALSLPLELALVRRFSLGVLGAGAAMLAREGVTLAVLLAAFRRRHRLIRPALRAISLRLTVFRDIMRSGLPTLLRQGLMSVSAALLTKACAGISDTALSGMGIAVRIVTLISSAVIGFGQGFQPVCGVSFGAGKMDRVSDAYRFCMRCVCAALLLLGGVLFVFAGPLLSPFSPEENVLLFAKSALRIQSLTLFAQGGVILMNMLTQSMGLTVRASIIATSRQGFVFIPLVLLLPRLFGAAGLLLCQSISDLLSLALCACLTRSVIKDFSCGRGGYSDARTASQ